MQIVGNIDYESQDPFDLFQGVGVVRTPQDNGAAQAFRTSLEENVGGGYTPFGQAGGYGVGAIGDSIAEEIGGEEGLAFVVQEVGFVRQ